MIKRFLIPLLLFFSLISFAQQGSASPYSLFGVGDIRFKGTNEIRAMGGVSVLPDSIHINPQNPASYSNLKLTTFTIGGSSNYIKFKTNKLSESAQRATMDYLGFGIPMGKVGATFGLNPFSSAGYKIKTIDNVSQTVRRYSADGGLNQAYLGFGFQVYKGLSLGANASYNFGNISSESIIYLAGLSSGTLELNESQLSGFSFNLGAMFNTKINQKLDFYGALTYIPQSNLDSSNKRTQYTVDYVIDGNPNRLDSLDTNYSNKKIQLPSTFTASTGFGQDKKWLIGAEVSFKDNNSFSNSLTSITNAEYENAIRYSIGGYYIPKYNSFNYFDRITYRGGFRYENTGLVINSVAIKDYAITGGMGMPISGSFSNVNLGLEFGRRGTTTGGLVEENYFNFMISLSFNDKWFRERKYE